MNLLCPIVSRARANKLVLAILFIALIAAAFSIGRYSNRWTGYDAQSLDDPAEKPQFNTQDATFSDVDYYPDTLVADRPGCEVIGCEPLFDGYRHGQRCHWRCRRPRPASPQYDAPAHVPVPHYENSAPRLRYVATGPDIDPIFGWGVLVFLLLCILQYVERHQQRLAFARETADVIEKQASYDAVAAKLHEAADAADDIINTFRKSANSSE